MGEKSCYSEMSAQSQTDAERQHPPHQYHQSTEQLYTPGWRLLSSSLTLHFIKYIFWFVFLENSNHITF